MDRRISAILSKTSARDFVFSNKNAKNKGQLIYSTCTFAPEENEEIISWLVENYPVTIEEIPLTQSVSSGRSEWGSVAGLEKQYVYGLIKIRVKDILLQS